MDCNKHIQNEYSKISICEPRPGIKTIYNTNYNIIPEYTK